VPAAARPSNAQPRPQTNPFALHWQPHTTRNAHNHLYKFKIATWNVLCEEYINHQGFYPYASKRLLRWPHRSSLILEILASSQCDFICMQEIDHWDDFYAAELPKRASLAFLWSKSLIFPLCSVGYGAIVSKRYGKPDLCTILYNKSKFSLKQSESVDLDELAQVYFDDRPSRYEKHCVATFATFYANNDPRQTLITIATTHIYWNPKFEVRRPAGQQD